MRKMRGKLSPGVRDDVAAASTVVDDVCMISYHVRTRRVVNKDTKMAVAAGLSCFSIIKVAVLT